MSILASLFWSGCSCEHPQEDVAGNLQLPNAAIICEARSATRSGKVDLLVVVPRHFTILNEPRKSPPQYSTPYSRPKVVSFATSQTTPGGGVRAAFACTVGHAFGLAFSFGTAFAERRLSASDMADRACASAEQAGFRLLESSGFGIVESSCVRFLESRLGLLESSGFLSNPRALFFTVNGKSQGGPPVLTGWKSGRWVGLYPWVRAAGRSTPVL